MDGTISTVSLLLAKAKFIIRTEGLFVLLRRGFESYVFHRDFCYIQKVELNPLREMNEAILLPRFEDFTFRIIRTNEEAEELAITLDHDFRERFVDARRRLDKGAIAFCAFVNGEIANIGWMAVTEQAKKTVDDVPLKADYSNSECYVGSMETIPKYRGLGLMSYTSYRMYQFRKEKGIKTAWYAIAENNFASRKAAGKLNPEVYARARYMRFLWWKFWKETPIDMNNF